MVEWQKHTHEENDVAKYTKLLEFRDLIATSTELHPLTQLKKNSNQSPIKKPKMLQTSYKPEFVHTTCVQPKCAACSTNKHSLAYCQAFQREVSK